MKRMFRAIFVLIFIVAALGFFLVVISSGAARMRAGGVELLAALTLLLAALAVGFLYRWLYGSETLRNLAFVLVGLFIACFLAGDILRSTGFCAPGGRAQGLSLEQVVRLFMRNGKEGVQYLLCPVSENLLIWRG